MIDIADENGSLKILSERPPDQYASEYLQGRTNYILLKVLSKFVLRSLNNLFNTGFRYLQIDLLLASSTLVYSFFLFFIVSFTTTEKADSLTGKEYSIFEPLLNNVSELYPELMCKWIFNLKDVEVNLLSSGRPL